MNNQIIISLIFQTVGTVLSVVTIVWRVQSTQTKKHQEELERLSKAFKDELSSVKTEVKDYEDLRRRGDHALHERMNNLESGIYKEINARLSHIEGQLKGVNNITRLMEEWLIENGGKLK